MFIVATLIKGYHRFCLFWMAMTTIISRVVWTAFRKLGYEVARRREPKASISKLDRANAFTDSLGNEFERLKGYRDLIKPS